ncbi:uncharacterized protein MONOS_16393 [Monocercomonoides exilis]|uniref:uncharacterized protein n=1 Tax=Monocercomonoides exilis TaxID=2049356 RepID=UPI003559ADFF|nr:hypothetical protein MONOS_16393 [Monocercomonoides exilis]|eukprot:MONOS_16393.1-p1 / transcript=MONOS_16393.1 / gene=MONOS_16393 / organism=Monocercomonoides_exilis_PA203 / gene_product=unspecified product / transcript_product=unspecified product / location=Mono_scaffold01701:3188-3622(+) / protein_length=124 / sequence_SO=supercontig / SO=protein_coding / is_pseudo=false
MKEKAELIDVGIEKEKKRRTQQGGVVSEDSEGAGSGAGASLATPSSLSSAGGGEVQSSVSVILLQGLQDINGNEVVVIVGDKVNVVGGANIGEGKSVCGGGRADAIELQKISKMKWETMLTSL